MCRAEYMQELGARAFKVGRLRLDPLELLQTIAVKSSRTDTSSFTLMVLAVVISIRQQGEQVWELSGAMTTLSMCLNPFLEESKPTIEQHCLQRLEHSNWRFGLSK